MNSTYKKIALGVCLSAGLIGVGYYMGQGKQNPAPEPVTQQPAAPEIPLVTPIEAPKAEVAQEPVAPKVIPIASTLPLETMTGLTVRSVADFEIFKSDTPSIEIVGDSQELIDSIKTEMVGPNLIVSHVLTKTIKAKCGNTSVTIEPNGNTMTMNVNSGAKKEKSHCALVKIGVKKIPAIQLEKSGNVHFTGADEQQLLLKIAGSGNISGEGKVDDLLLWISGSGNIDTADVQARKLMVLSEGSGNVNASVTGQLQSALSGSGNVNIFGNPTSTQHEENGSGKFRLFSAPSK